MLNKADIYKQKPHHYAYDELKVPHDADFLNVDFSNDNPYFLNPYHIETLKHPLARIATQIAIDWFESTRLRIIDKDFVGAREIFCKYLSEPKETCLGYSSSGICGKGIRDMAEYILYTIYQDKSLLYKVIRRIEDVKLFVKHVGDDRVSDIYTNVIRKVLINYTKEQCDYYGIPTVCAPSKMYWDIESHNWKSSYEQHLIWSKDRQTKLLIPKCFVNGGAYNNSRLNRFIIVPALIDNELKNNPHSPLIRHRKDGTSYITKKSMTATLTAQNIVLDKDYARQFAIDNPNCIINLKNILHNRNGN